MRNNSLLIRVLKLQSVLGLLVVLVSAAMAGRYAAASAFLGSVCVVVPSAWFVWRLISSLKTTANAPKVLAFFVGEVVKVAMTALLMVLVVLSFKPLVWPAFLAALIMTLKAQLLVIVFKSF